MYGIELSETNPASLERALSSSMEAHSAQDGRPPHLRTDRGVTEAIARLEFVAVEVGDDPSVLALA